jgi:hypothetical protein
MAVCTTVLPVVKADLCDADIHFGEISMLMFTRLGDGLTDWTDDTEWATRMDNASTGTTALPTSGLADIRQLFGIGSIGKAERTEIKLPRKTKGYTAPKYNFTFLVTDTGDANMAFSRALPVGGQVYSAWFGTEERLFGGNSGVTMTVISDPTIPDNADDIMRLELTLSFEGVFPEVTDNILV